MNSRHCHNQRLRRSAMNRSKYQRPGSLQGAELFPLDCQKLELVPQELVVNVVVELHFRRLDHSSQQSRATVGCCLLQLGETALHVVAQQLRGPCCTAEVGQCVVDVVGQVALCLAQVLDLCSLALQSSLEHCQHHHVGVRIRTNRANFHAHALL